MNPYTNILVRYSCGCIGLPKRPDNSAVLLWWCDASTYHHDGDPHGIGTRDMSGKIGEPVSSERAQEIFERLADLVAKGLKFEEIKNLLG